MEQLLSSMAVMMNMNSSSNDLQRAFEKISSKGIPKGKFKGKKFRNFNNKIWICKSFNGHPTIILKSKKTNKDTLGQYYSHIEIMHNKNYKIIEENGSEVNVHCTYIKCYSEDEDLQKIFFDTLLPVLKKLSFPVKPEEVNNLTKKLIELFKLLEKPARKKVQGLWAELFLIYLSDQPRYMVSSWHNEPDDIHDFSEGTNFIEVKSTMNSERKHIFSLSQTIVESKNLVLIASFIMEEDELGMSIEDLETKILKRIKQYPDASEQLKYLIRATLGKDWKKKNNKRFSPTRASDDLKFFNLEDIPKLDKSLQNIRGVSNISFTSDLNSCSEANRKKFIKKSKLYKAVLN